MPIIDDIQTEKNDVGRKYSRTSLFSEFNSYSKILTDQEKYLYNKHVNLELNFEDRIEKMKNHYPLKQSPIKL